MRPHYRQDCPEGYTLALDTAGPFCVGRDVDNKKEVPVVRCLHLADSGDVAEEGERPDPGE